MRAWKWLAAATAVAAVLAAGASSAVAASPIENGDPSISYGGWVTVSDASAYGGQYRASPVKGDTVKFSFHGTSLGWLTRVGPDQGEARVTLDGVSQGTVNEYAATAAFQQTMFNGLAPGGHRLVIKVLGKHSAASAGNEVVVNGFSVNNHTPVAEDAPGVVYDLWKTTKTIAGAASGASFQSTSKPGRSVSLTFSGVGVTWVTATAPNYGFADVNIDGVDQGDVDLYGGIQQWQVDETYSGLTNGTHTITITARGTHDASATGSSVVLDSLIAIPQPTLTSIAVTPSDSTLRQGQTLQYAATGSYSDGSQQDLTGQVTWSTNPSTLATISNAAGSQGLLTAIGGSQNGLSVQVTAALGSVSGSTNLGLYCRLHQNGLGGTYSDCAPLGIPGNASTYNQTMATEAALSWGHGTNAVMYLCGNSAPYQDIISIDNTNGPSANWSYTNGTEGPVAGHVNTNPTGIADLCPVSTDATWN